MRSSFRCLPIRPRGRRRCRDRRTRADPELLTPGAHDDRANVAWAGEESAKAGLHRVSEGDGSIRLRPHARQSRRLAPLSGPGCRSRIHDPYPVGFDRVHQGLRGRGLRAGPLLPARPGVPHALRPQGRALRGRRGGPALAVIEPKRAIEDSVLDREFARLLARYKTWADRLTFEAVAALPAGEAERGRPTLFKSIVSTLNHSYVVDLIWQAHLEGRPHGFTARNVVPHPELEALWPAQQQEIGRAHV